MTHIPSFLSLSDAFVAYPECIGLEITDFSSFRKFELAFRESDDKVEFKEIQIENRDIQQLEHEILSQTHWQVLHLRFFETTGTLTRQIVPHISVFTQLYDLSINYRSPYYYYSEEENILLPVSLTNLPHLKYLNLRDVSLEKVESLPSVEVLLLDNLPSDDSLLILQNVNPEKIRFLSLENFKLTTLPSIVAQFTNLERLDLINTQISQLPDWIILFKKLKSLSLYGNPVLRETELKHTIVIKLIKLGAKRKLTPSQLVLYLSLCQNQTPEASVNDLIVALSLDIELLQRKAMNLLRAKVANPFEVESENSRHFVSLQGTFKGTSVEEITTQLERHTIQTSKEILQSTTLIAIGDILTQKEAENVIKHSLPLTLPHHLRDFLQHLEIPYLKESDAETQQNLLNMLRSRDKVNTQLAIEIMLGGGIPDELFYCVFLLSLWRGISKTQFVKLIEKYATPEQYDFFKKQQKAGFYKTVDEIFKRGIFDINMVAKAGLQIFMLSGEERNGTSDGNEESFYRPFHYIVKRCFVMGGEPARLAYKAQLEGTTLNILFSDDSYFGKFKLPLEILEFTEIERIICSQNVMTEVVTNPKTLQKMPNLKELILYYYSANVSLYQSEQEKLQKGLEKLQKMLPNVHITLQSY
jgi:hypothetical protein